MWAWSLSVREWSFCWLPDGKSWVKKSLSAVRVAVLLLEPWAEFRSGQCNDIFLYKKHTISGNWIHTVTHSALNNGLGRSQILNNLESVWEPGKGNWWERKAEGSALNELCLSGRMSHQVPLCIAGPAWCDWHSCTWGRVVWCLDIELLIGRNEFDCWLSHGFLGELLIHWGYEGWIQICTAQLVELCYLEIQVYYWFLPFLCQSQWSPEVLCLLQWY